MICFWYANGEHEPVIGETINIVGAASETAEVWSFDYGNWGAGTAAGVMRVINCSQDFIDNAKSGDDIEDSDSNKIADVTSNLIENCHPDYTGYECYLQQHTGSDIGMECLLEFDTDDIDVVIYTDGTNFP